MTRDKKLSPRNELASSISQNQLNDVLKTFEALRSERIGYLEKIAQQIGWIAITRGCLFLAAAAAVISGLANLYGVSVLWFTIASLLGIAFFVAAAVHETYERRRKTLSLLLDYCDESIARINRDWKKIRVSKITAPSDRVAVAHDLDLFGSCSLFQLLGTVQLPAGIESLRQWISYPETPDTISKRQIAVAELSEHLDWIERFHLRCRLLAASPSGPSALIRWASANNDFRFAGFLGAVGFLGPIAVVLALIGFASGIINPFVAGCIFVGVPAINFLLSVIFIGGIHETFTSISSKHREVEHYRTIFSMVAGHDSDSEYLIDLKKRMVTENHDARVHLNTLGLIVWAANLRRHGILFLVYLFLQFVCLWDVHVLGWLERWRKRNSEYVADWFDALGDWEAVTALAQFKACNPHWVFPNCDSKEPTPFFAAKHLGHPLLRESDRVANDVNVGPPGKVMLVTGSNMSGKSTLLRSIGQNAVLAQMGSVVCAHELSMTPMRIESSMRIHDSLADGVSFFMAELKRLKQIVDLADDYKTEKVTLLYLLDEILQGTNSRERHIAVDRVVKHMIAAGAIGAVSTHDLELAGADGLESACNVVHFREHFFEANGQKQMTFDYKMRQGIAPTTNALKLLDLVGLGE